jgi:hypothetical protein
MSCRTIAGGAGDELRSVLPAVREAASDTSAPPAGFPVAVLASKAFGDRWVGWQQEQAAAYIASSYRATGTKLHNIHLRHPDLIVETVLDMVSSGVGTDAGRPT